MCISITTNQDKHIHSFIENISSMPGSAPGTETRDDPCGKINTGQMDKAALGSDFERLWDLLRSSPREQQGSVVWSESRGFFQCAMPVQSVPAQSKDVISYFLRIR